MNVELIKNEKELTDAILRLEQLSEPSIKENSAEWEEGQILSVLIKHYESSHFEELEAPDPIEFIKIRMENMNLKPKDLIGIIGSKTTVSHVLNKKANLTLNMIRILSDMLHIPIKALVKKYELNGNKELEIA